jgi:hypothetical protein
MQHKTNASPPPRSQGLSEKLVHRLDEAERTERAALAAHDVARAGLRKAQSAYRAHGRKAIHRDDMAATLPADDAQAQAAVFAAAEDIVRWQNTHKQLMRLDENSAALIDAAVQIERAKLDYDALKLAYQNKDRRHG